MIQPFIAPSCSIKNESQCVIKDSTMAMWVKKGKSDSCSVERTASLAGLLYADKSGNRKVILDKFISATSNVVE